MSDLLQRLGQIGVDLFGEAQISVEHWAKELRAEERRVVMMGVQAGATLFAGAMTVVLITALTLLLLPAHQRILGLAMFAGLFLIAFGVLARGMRRQFARSAHLPATSGIVFMAQILRSIIGLIHRKTSPKQSP